MSLNAFDMIPDEVLLAILAKLPASAIKSAILTEARFHRLMKDQEVWKQQYKKYFQCFKPDENPETDYQSKFKIALKEFREWLVFHDLGEVPLNEAFNALRGEIDPELERAARSDSKETRKAALLKLKMLYRISIINGHDIPIFAIDNRGKALLFACEFGHSSLIDKILNQADDFTDSSLRVSAAFTAAAKKGHLNIIKHWWNRAQQEAHKRVQKKERKFSIVRDEAILNVVFNVAYQQNHVDVVRYFLEEVFDLKSIKLDMRSAALATRQPEACMVLLQQDKYEISKENMLRFLNSISAGGWVEQAKYILENKMQGWSKEEANKAIKSAIFKAAKLGRFELVKYFHEQTLFKLSDNPYGRGSEILSAVENEHLPIVQYMLEDERVDQYRRHLDRAYINASDEISGLLRPYASYRSVLYRNTQKILINFLMTVRDAAFILFDLPRGPSRHPKFLAMYLGGVGTTLSFFYGWGLIGVACSLLGAYSLKVSLQVRGVLYQEKANAIKEDKTPPAENCRKAFEAGQRAQLGWKPYFKEFFRPNNCIHYLSHGAGLITTPETHQSSRPRHR